MASAGGTGPPAPLGELRGKNRSSGEQSRSGGIFNIKILSRRQREMLVLTGCTAQLTPSVIKMPAVNLRRIFVLLFILIRSDSTLYS